MSRFRVTLHNAHTLEVAFTHIRPQNPRDKAVLIQGHYYNGATICQFWSSKEKPEDRERLAYGQTVCALCDNFCRKTGRLIAFRRAVDAYTKNPFEKKAFWTAYHEWERTNRKKGEEAALTALALKGTANAGA